MVVNVIGETFQYLLKVPCGVKAGGEEANIGMIQAQGPAAWAR